MTTAAEPAVDSPSRMADDGTMTLTVTSITQSASDIRTFTFAASEGATLPGFVPGSHLVVQAGEHANAYSLVSDGTAPTEYAISVLRVADGNGGSRWMHDVLAEGDTIAVHLPRNAFAPIARAAKHLLIAGGIGITPMVSHLRAARRWHRATQVLYTHRADNAAHLDDITALTDGACELFTARDAFTTRLDEVLRDQPIGTHLYVCGPGPMIDAVVDAATAAGWPDSRIHFERFGIDALDAGDPFRVHLSGSDTIVDVPSGTSMLTAIENAGVAVPNRCRQGVCGECRIPLSGGTPIHRDLYLTDEEKTAGDCVMPCVSRADAGAILEIPL
ncbi:PDR/VanB family oxidoreductase [Gordonia sp. VNQ95]|uniref:PDR/VanB family oxidoreductase n=1 Tax=Gordonia TaxID=2053 RepID=UPI0032B32553